MAEQKEEKSLSAWRLELKRYGKSHWLVFYQHFLGTPVASSVKFYRFLNLYGDWAMFEAILATSQANIVGDPLNYCLKVCHAKWKEMQEDEESEKEYSDQIEQIKKTSQQRNEALAKKLKKVNK